MRETTGDEPADAALAEIARRDPAEAELAREAFGWLTWGQGLSSVTMFELCEWLWYQLPAKWTGSLAEQLQAAGALGALFDHLGMPRYADLCASETTARVLTAWSRSEEDGFKAMKAARATSGVEPPDVPGMMEWGSVMGPEEATALYSTASRLEIALAAGEFVPGNSGWRTAARKITARHLTSSEDLPGDDCLLERVHAERLEHWAKSRGPFREWLAAELSDSLTTPSPAPEDAGDRLAPIGWLLGIAAGDGVPLTKNHTLARAVVADGCERFGWLTGSGRPRSENDIMEARTLRTIAQELGAVRRQGQRLLLTPAGRRLAAADPQELWTAVVPKLLPADPTTCAVAEIGLMLILSGTDANYFEFTALIAEAMTEEGWHNPTTGQSVSAGTAGWLLGELHRRLYLLGLLKDGFGNPADRLTGHGRAAALGALRAHAMRPRTQHE